MTFTDFSSLSKAKPQRRLSSVLKKHAGRDKTGQISVRHQGGGCKRKYRAITSLDQVTGGKITVLGLEYDPNRTAFIMLGQDINGRKYYLIAPEGVKTGSEIEFNAEKAKNSAGHRTKLKNIIPGTKIYELEITPSAKAKIVRSAGSTAQLLAVEGKNAQVKLPSGTVRQFSSECLATIGTVSNSAHSTVRLGSAGRVRHMGIRPTVRGKAMHPAAHPHGGGEGVNPIGLKYPKTPTGRHALGTKTRRNKRTDVLIIKDRRKK